MGCRCIWCICMLKKESAFLRKPGANFFSWLNFSQPSTINQWGKPSHPRYRKSIIPVTAIIRNLAADANRFEALKLGICCFFSKRMNLRNWQTRVPHQKCLNWQSCWNPSKDNLFCSHLVRGSTRKKIIEVHGVSRPHNHIDPYQIIFAQGGGPIHSYLWYLEDFEQYRSLRVPKTNKHFFPEDIRGSPGSFWKWPSQKAGFHPTKPRCNNAETRCRRDCLERPEGFADVEKAREARWSNVHFFFGSWGCFF